MSGSRFLHVEEVITMHQDVIDVFGGAAGLRDRGALESAVARPAMGYYADAVAEAAALMESLALNHPFLDGNKRVAYLAAETQLSLSALFIDADGAAASEFVVDSLERGDFELATIEPWLRDHVRPMLASVVGD